MKTFKLILAALSISIAIVGVATALPAETRTQPASASPAFDHSQCQYPDRTTNPPNGCDNSDPCDPASAAKGGSGECAPVQPEQPREPVVTAPAPSQPVNQCGGK